MVVVDKKKERGNSRIVREKQSDGMVEDRLYQLRQTPFHNEDGDLVDIVLADPLRFRRTSSPPLPARTTATGANTRRQRRLRSLYGNDYEATSTFIGSSSSSSGSSSSSNAILDYTPIIHNDGSGSGGSGGGGTLASRAIVFGFVIVGIVYLIYKVYSDHRKLQKHNLQRLKLRWDEISRIFQENNTRMVRTYDICPLLCLLRWLVGCA